MPCNRQAWRLSARSRITLATSAVALATAATTVAVMAVAMTAIPSYAFTTASEVAGTPSAPLPLATVISAPTPITGVVVADPLDVLRLLLIFGAIALVVVGVGGIWGSWIVAGRTLRPLQDLTAAVDKASSGSFTHRVGLVNADTEFRALGDSFDGMLRRLEVSFHTNERFAANASHELRTPLATTKLLLDVARLGPHSAPTRLLLDRLAAMNERTVAITTALLDLADTSTYRLTRVRSDIASIVASAVMELEQLTESQAVAVAVDVEATSVLADQVLVERVLVNLLRNAVQHNRPEGQAWVTVRRLPPPDAEVVIRVENTGDVVRGEEALRFEEPFNRGRGRTAPAPNTSGDSHGLGLALVRRIVDAHEGELRIFPRDGGGLIVEVTFPDGPSRR